MTEITPPTSAQPLDATRHVWSIAFPAMITNVATALFGIADMWVIGRLGDPAAQGGVELGAKYMLGILNIFVFLRSSTVALTAQSAMSSDANAQAATLARALATSLTLGGILVMAMPLAIPLGLNLLEATGPVRESASQYIAIRYLAGPAWLANCVLIGWLIGRRRMAWVLIVEVVTNLVHIGLDLGLVLGAEWGVRGVAAATMMSEGLKFLLLAYIAFTEPAARAVRVALFRSDTWASPALRQQFSLNRDLFGRTILLTCAMLLFARTGAQQGPVVLAANGILFQFFMLATLILDGFESAAQVLCGEALGKRDRALLLATLRATLTWGGVCACLIAIVYFLSAPHLAASFNTNASVTGITAQYFGWVAILGMLGYCSFILDGVFVGAGWSRAMFGTMLSALAKFVFLLALLMPLGNNGLWIAFCAFFVARAGAQFMLLPRLIERDFSPRTA